MCADITCKDFTRNVKIFIFCLKRIIALDILHMVKTRGFTALLVKKSRVIFSSGYADNF